jgi:sec-independent protein translocase protein TatA
MPAIGLPELIIILLIVLVLFGASRLPKLAKSIGESKKELQKGLKGDDKDDKKES